MRRHRNFIIIGAVFLSLCVKGISLVAAAQASLPGDRIYAVKLGLERLRLNLAPDDVTRARLYLETLNQVLPAIGSIVVVQEDQLSPVPLLNLRQGQVLPQNTSTTQ